MPFTYTCPDHPDVAVDPNEVGISDHAMTHHPDQPLGVVADGMIRAFESQVVAQGGTVLRVMGCRSCGKRVETRDPDRAPYCDDHNG